MDLDPPHPPSQHRERVKRVAIIDFDVHHGNGTEACVSNVTPRVVRQKVAVGGSDGSGVFALEGLVKSQYYKPWVGEQDTDNILFVSCQGYGESLPGHTFYPGTGATVDTRPPAGKGAVHDSSESTSTAMAGYEFLGGDNHEFSYGGGVTPSFNGPRIINVGIQGPGSQRRLLHRAWRAKILPAVARHRPDFLFISAGFDAHAKDEMNLGYIGLLESDYTWVTRELMKIANQTCGGRIVSILEGGYRIQGGLVSPFARSVAAHVKALAENHGKGYDVREAERESAEEAAKEAARQRAKQDELALLLADQEEDPIVPSSDYGGGAGVGAMPMLGEEPKGKEKVPEADGAEAAAGGAAASTRPSKRSRRDRGKQVDYVALNAQLEREAKQGNPQA